MWRWASGVSAYGDVVSRSGVWSALLLIPATIVTLLRLMFRPRPWLIWLAERRVDLGAASFAYAGVHAATYVIGKQNFGVALREAGQPWLLSGWIALLIFIAFAWSTDDAAVQLLRHSWKWLSRFDRAGAALGVVHQAVKRWHRVVYIGAVLVFAHWVLAAFDPLTEQVQTALQTYGYYYGPIDGVIGPASTLALQQFQRDYSLPITGTITPAVLDVLGIVPN